MHAHVWYILLPHQKCQTIDNTNDDWNECEGNKLNEKNGSVEKHMYRMPYFADLSILSARAASAECHQCEATINERICGHECMNGFIDSVLFGSGSRNKHARFIAQAGEAEKEMERGETMVCSLTA